jgi:signal transduction histidine kinase
LTNAVAHNVDGGWITVVLRSTPDAAELIVTNSSANLTAGQLAELREPFRRAGAARIQSDSGTGLGLAIVDAIASVHGWTLTLSIPEPNAFRAAVSIPRSPLDGR